MKICYDQSWNDIGVTPSPILLAGVFSALELFFQNRLWELFPPTADSMFVNL